MIGAKPLEKSVSRKDHMTKERKLYKHLQNHNKLKQQKIILLFQKTGGGPEKQDRIEGIILEEDQFNKETHWEKPRV